MGSRPFVRNVQVAWIFQVAASFQVGQVEANLQVRGVVPAAKVVRCEDMFWQRESRMAFWVKYCFTSLRKLPHDTMAKPRDRIDSSYGGRHEAAELFAEDD